jgi:hypothetical protein
VNISTNTYNNVTRQPTTDNRKLKIVTSCIFFILYFLLTVTCKLGNFVNGVNKMNISIISTGYVGLVTGSCLVDLGLSVGTPRQVPPSLRATEGSAAIPPPVFAREQSDRSNPNLNRRTGVPRFHEGRLACLSYSLNKKRDIK